MTQNLNKSILKRYYKALNTAIIEGNLECFKTDLVIALKAGYPMNFAPASGGYKGMTLLHSALCTGLHHTSYGPTFAEILLDNGADVNIKDSSVLNVIAVTELYYRLMNIASTTFAFLESYIVLAIIYLVLTLLASGCLKLVEKKMDGVKFSLNPFRWARNREAF